MERAATKIQSTFRGHRARKQLHQRSGDTGEVSDIDLNDPSESGLFIWRCYGAEEERCPDVHYKSICIGMFDLSDVDKSYNLRTC